MLRSMVIAPTASAGRLPCDLLRTFLYDNLNLLAVRVTSLCRAESEHWQQRSMRLILMMKLLTIRGLIVGQGGRVKVGLGDVFTEVDEEFD